ncbi:8194_t:CDS:2 [Funneliformis geosporum]|uniref:8194_t:CDS:1 n=1 Tax=Funneliformis geosporum TaxID=1117311 RepID=A0A9W4SIU1_9GLOM|nr:8194_t:CDS:2 [Funneliformis geosporum]
MTEKKVLAQQIKADLAKDLEETKKEVSPTAPENKGKRDLIAPNELEKEDYEEILSLMETIRTTATKVSEQKKQAEEAELDQKLQRSENVPFEQKSSGSLPCKLVKSSDKITITPVDNSPYIKRLQGQKSYSEKYLEKTQKESPDKHDNKLPTPSKKRNKPTDKLTNLLLGELNNKNLLQYFQNNNVKSIKLDNNNLVIEYNDKQAKETKALNNQE